MHSYGTGRRQTCTSCCYSCHFHIGKSQRQDLHQYLVSHLKNDVNVQLNCSLILQSVWLFSASSFLKLKMLKQNSPTIQLLLVIKIKCPHIWRGLSRMVPRGKTFPKKCIFGSSRLQLKQKHNAQVCPERGPNPWPSDHGQIISYPIDAH